MIKMLREIIKIDEDLCDGCGNCVPGCHEGALQIIDGKARLVSELMCDGLGACIGDCPQGAIIIERREAEPYNETRAMEILLDKDTRISFRSELTNWPVQMHLINPSASHYRDADVLLAADCAAFTVPNFHSAFLKGKKLAIACPKLDQGTEIYIEKIRSLIDEANIRSLHVLVMEVPCCGGLSRMVQIARSQARRDIPVEVRVVGIHGELLKSINI